MHRNGGPKLKWNASPGYISAWTLEGCFDVENAYDAGDNNKDPRGEYAYDSQPVRFLEVDGAKDVYREYNQEDIGNNVEDCSRPCVYTQIDTLSAVVAPWSAGTAGEEPYEDTSGTPKHKEDEACRTNT